MPIKMLLTNTPDSSSKPSFTLTVNETVIDSSEADLSNTKMRSALFTLMRLESSIKATEIQNTDCLRRLLIAINQHIETKKIDLEDGFELTLSEPASHSTSHMTGTQADWNQYIQAARKGNEIAAEKKIKTAACDRKNTIRSVAGNFTAFTLLTIGSAVGFTVLIPFLIPLIGGTMASGDAIVGVGLICVVAAIAALFALGGGINSACQLSKMNGLLKKANEPVKGVPVEDTVPAFPLSKSS